MGHPLSDAPEERTCACGKPIEDYPYLSDTCHDCYAEAWDKGFEASSEWAEHLFGEEEEPEPEAADGDPESQ